MILSDEEIVQAIERGELAFNPAISLNQIRASSVDLRLGHEITFFEEDPGVYGYGIKIRLGDNLDVERGVEKFGRTQSYETGEYFALKKDDFILAYTLESITLGSSLAARVEGRSTLGRLGISIHQTAPTVHPNFSGRLRLEISHNGPFECEITPEYTICQLIIERVGQPVQAADLSRYQNQ